MTKTIQTLLVAASVTVLAACGSDAASNESGTSAPGSTAVASSATVAQPASTTPTLPTTPITDAPELTTAPGGDQVPATTPARGKAPAPTAVNRKDAKSVAEAFVVTRDGWDARTDSSPQEAIERATAYTTPTFANNLRMNVGEPGGDYAELEQKDGYATVALTGGATTGGASSMRYTGTREVTAHYQDGTSKVIAKGPVSIELNKDDTGVWWVIAAK